MNLLKNYIFYFKLSIISLILSLLILNISLYFYDSEKAVIITLVAMFLFNFYNLNKRYKFNNSNIFFIYSILTSIFSRTIEYHLFFIILNILIYHNVSWLITIFITHFLKFFFVEIYKTLTIKK